jgi:hypothetical protein
MEAADIDRDAIKEALCRADIRKAMADNVDTHMKATSPGVFKDDRNWVTWYSSSCSYLAGIPGVTGIPAIYVIYDPVAEDNMDVDLDYVDLLVAQASREGTIYEADVRLVHNLILGFVTGQNAEQWIKQDKGKCDGWLDMVALVDH